MMILLLNNNIQYYSTLEEIRKKNLKNLKKILLSGLQKFFSYFINL